MPRYEYKVVPAPKKAVRVRGVKGTEARFAHNLATLMNELGADGWEYQRTDTLPCEERRVFGKRTVEPQNMLVFRRALDVPAEVTPVAGRVPSADAIASVHSAAPAPEPRAEPALAAVARPVAVEPAEPANAPEAAREEATMPSFRAARTPAALAAEQGAAPRMPRLGAARREVTPGPTLVRR